MFFTSEKSIFDEGPVGFTSDVYCDLFGRMINGYPGID